MSTTPLAERMRLSLNEAADVARDCAGRDVEDLTLGERAAVVVWAELERERADSARLTAAYLRKTS